MEGIEVKPIRRRRKLAPAVSAQENEHFSSPAAMFMLCSQFDVPRAEGAWVTRQAWKQGWSIKSVPAAKSGSQVFRTARPMLVF
jgi:hypothetical protein